MFNQSGKFVVIYGVNGIGKTTQAKLLADYFNRSRQEAKYLKYPVYDVNPSGLVLNDYLRRGNKFKLSPREAQVIFTLNRTQFEPQLKEMLKQGVNIIAEDYTQTGIAWGITNGIKQEFLEMINSHLIKENLSILLDGTPFVKSLNPNHLYEKNYQLIKKAREIFLQLAHQKKWPIISANQSINEVHRQIVSLLV